MLGVFSASVSAVEGVCCPSLTHFTWPLLLLMEEWVQVQPCVSLSLGTETREEACLIDWLIDWLIDFYILRSPFTSTQNRTLISGCCRIHRPLRLHPMVPNTVLWRWDPIIWISEKPTENPYSAGSRTRMSKAGLGITSLLRSTGGSREQQIQSSHQGGRSMTLFI